MVTSCPGCRVGSADTSKPQTGILYRQMFDFLPDLEEQDDYTDIPRKADQGKWGNKQEWKKWIHAADPTSGSWRPSSTTHVDAGGLVIPALLLSD